MDHERLLMRRGVSDAASSPPAQTPRDLGDGLDPEATGPTRASSTEISGGAIDHADRDDVTDLVADGLTPGRYRRSCGGYRAGRRPEQC